MGLNVNPFQSSSYPPQQSIQGIQPKVDEQNTQIGAYSQSKGSAGSQGVLKGSPLLNTTTSGLSFCGRDGVEGGVTVTGQAGRETGVAGKKLNLIA